MKKLLAIIAATMISGSAHAYIGMPPRGCAAESVCRVHNSIGGLVSAFEETGDAISHGDHKLVIDGFCNSSCVIMADRARPHACITPTARFGFHRTSWGRPIPVSADLNAWALAHGGYPKFGHGITVMPNAAARQFWPLCSEYHGGGAHL